MGDAVTSDHVDRLAKETWQANLAFSAASRDAVEKALKVGKLLVAARAELPDDLWRAHLLGASVTEEQAQLLMQLTTLVGPKALVSPPKPLGSERYKPLLQFLVGLIASSVALIAAALSVMKDALQKEAVAWKLPLLSFMGWMAAAIFSATFVGLIIQHRRMNRDPDVRPNWLDYCLIGVPIIAGLIAASFLIKFALAQGADVLPWRPDLGPIVHGIRQFGS